MIKEHLKDIDFRTREQRQKDWKKDFISWYETLHASQSKEFNSEVQAQVTMLSNVLWYLLPADEYKKLTRRDTRHT